MIAKKYRFHGYNALTFVYKQGRTARGQLCLLRYAANPRRRHYRIAVVVGKKISKSAVVRNRIRRRVFEAVRSLAQGTGDWPAVDFVFTVVDDRIMLASEKDIKNIISQLLQATAVRPVAVDK